MHSSIPKYVKLIEIIKADIQRHVLVPQQKLPNEDELAKQYGMSRGTVRKAIAELQRIGAVRKEQGRGTFVNESKPALSSFSLADFDGYIRAQNRIPSTKTLLFETIHATHEMMGKLDIPLESDVIHLVQLRLASEMPIIYEERFFAKALCPDITQESIEEHSIHWLLIEKYNLPLIRLSHTIEVATLPDDKFALFKVNEAVSAFAVDRLSFTKTHREIRPAVWYRALYRADEYQFQAQFHTSI